MRLVCLILSAACIGYGQTDGIFTSVSRNVPVTADEADFTIVAATGLDTTADQVVQVFQTAGLQNLSVTASGIGQSYDYSSGQQQVQAQAVYQLSFIVPAPNMKDAAKKLEGLRTSLPDTLKSLQYSAFANASQAAVDAAHQTVLPLLLADAQKKGQALATAAGIKLGAIKGVNESAYGGGIGVGAIGGVISSTNFLIGTVGTTSSAGGGGTQYTFYASVTFAVTP